MKNIRVKSAEHLIFTGIPLILTSHILKILKRLIQIQLPPPRLSQVNVTKNFKFFSAKIAVTRITSLGLR